jgi:hypothetical protein
MNSMGTPRLTFTDKYTQKIDDQGIVQFRVYVTCISNEKDTKSNYQQSKYMEWDSQ